MIERDTGDRAHSKIKRRLTRTGVGLAIALVMMLTVRTAVAQVFVVPLGSMEPEIPAGSRALVYKLADRYEPGQIVVYRYSGTAHIARVDGADSNAGTLTVSRNGTEAETIARGAVIGRVVLHTR